MTSLVLGVSLAAWTHWYVGSVGVAGDAAPITRLFGGNTDAWAAFDPSTVISRHGTYHHTVAGWFTVAAPGNPNADVAARTLCALGHTSGIDCATVPQQGKHDWTFAARAFPAALPWLAGQLGTPAVPRSPLPAVAAAPGADYPLAYSER